MTRYLSRTAWLALVGVAILVALVALSRAALDGHRRATEAKGEATMAQGRTTSAVEAIEKIGELGERAGATDQQVKDAQDDLRQAAPSDRDRVFRHRVCVMQQRTDCDRLFGARSANPDAGNAPR